MNRICILGPIHGHRDRWKTDTHLEEDVIDQITIVLAGLPALAADLVERAVELQPDMAVIARVGSVAGLLEFAQMTPPEVVIVGLSEPELPPQCLQLMTENTALTVLGLQQNGDRAHLYQMRPQHFELGGVTPNDLIGYIRTAVQGDPGA
jgi:hypothetical protein